MDPHSSISRRRWLAIITAGGIAGCRTLERPGAGSVPAPPGVVIAHSPARSGLYIGSPSIAVLPNGDYIATHDFFGPNSDEHRQAISRVYRSSDRGRRWTWISDLRGAFWSTLFVHGGQLYLLGTDRHHGRVVIRRSVDGGVHWTQPLGSTTGVLRSDAEYHGAPVPVVEHQGRLWRALEWRNPPKAWGVNYRAGVLSAPVDADLLDAASWKTTRFLSSDRSWNGGDMGAWLEGNVVVAPDGRLVNILRVDTQGLPERAAWVSIDGPEEDLRFDPRDGFITLPGGSKKFTIRFDPRSRRYWTLASVVPRGWEPAGKPARTRNTLGLVSSSDLTTWSIRCHLLHDPDRDHVGFQYVDWLFDGDDLIAVCRTAFPDGLGGAHSAHDANFLTFHRIRRFRDLGPGDSVPISRFDALAQARRP
ncbi:MAG: sialidase family protein [Verrucomicrobiota bacterium]